MWGNEMIKLTENEIKYITESPEGLEIIMNYHDEQMCLGQSMGFNCSGNQERYEELKVERDRLREEYET